MPFLRHALAQTVGLGERHAGDRLCDLDHLFLIDEAAVGIAQHRLEPRVQHLHRLQAQMAFEILALAAVVRHSRADDRRQRGQHLEVVAVRLLEELQHDRTFDVEAAFGAAGAQELAAARIVQHVDRLGIDPQPVVALDLADRVADHRQALLSEDVDLDEAGVLDRVHVPRDPEPFVAALQRHDVGDRFGCDHHSARVRRQVARVLGDTLGDREDAAKGLAVERQVAPRRIASDRFPEAACRDEARQAFDDRIDFAEADAERFRHLAHRRTCMHRAVGADHGDVLAAIALEDVVEHDLTIIGAEVDVEIREALAFEIEEAFEEQVVRERTHASRRGNS